MNVLIIAAHPDDDTFGMGGTIFKHTSNGDVVNVAYLATGIAARRSSGYKNSTLYEPSQNERKKIEKEITIIRHNAKKACHILKVKSVTFFDLPDNEMDSVPLLKIIKTVEGLITKFKPERIYTNYYGDLNIDHRTVFNATLTACRPQNNQVKEILCFEVPSSTEWNYPNNFQPNYFVNIDKERKKKIQAIKMYMSEIRKFPHPRSEENIESLAKHWGSVSGQNSAEAFQIIRMIKK